VTAPAPVARPRTEARRRGRTAVLLGALLLGASLAGAGDDLSAFPECEYCGMERKAFGYSRMVVTYEDGTSAGVCSLHCAVTEMNAKPGKAVRKLEVADRDARTLVDAGAATWVLGGSKRGVMAVRAKWAFATPAAAEAFVKRHGGEIVGWERALAAAREDAAVADAQERARARRGTGCAGSSQARRPDHEEPVPAPQPPAPAPQERT
jgi:nitrous oxide reductase accessory protein NosL